jgi:hypothetical protein
MIQPTGCCRAHPAPGLTATAATCWSGWRATTWWPWTGTVPGWSSRSSRRQARWAARSAGWSRSRTVGGPMRSSTPRASGARCGCGGANGPGPARRFPARSGRSPSKTKTSPRPGRRCPPGPPGGRCGSCVGSTPAWPVWPASSGSPGGPCGPGSDRCWPRWPLTRTGSPGCTPLGWTNTSGTMSLPRSVAPNGPTSYCQDLWIGVSRDALITS